MNAETITLTLTIRPSYARAATVKQEVEESLSWLSDDHNAVRIDWGKDGEGAWPDEEDEDEEDE